MTDVASMKARVLELNRMRDAIDEERRELEQRIAEKNAVWKPGARVLWRNRGEYEITGVRPGYGIDDVKYIGGKVLKSGEIGVAVELWGPIKAIPLQPELSANPERTGR